MREYAFRSVGQLSDLLDESDEQVAHACPTQARFYTALLRDVNWVGFYLLKDGACISARSGKPCLHADRRGKRRLRNRDYAETHAARG